jgi:hypothetical protein
VNTAGTERRVAAPQIRQPIIEFGLHSHRAERLDQMGLVWQQSSRRRTSSTKSVIVRGGLQTAAERVMTSEAVLCRPNDELRDVWAGIILRACLIST